MTRKAEPTQRVNLKPSEIEGYGGEEFAWKHSFPLPPPCEDCFFLSVEARWSRLINGSPSTKEWRMNVTSCADKGERGLKQQRHYNYVARAFSCAGNRNDDKITITAAATLLAAVCTALYSECCGLCCPLCCCCCLLSAAQRQAKHTKGKTSTGNNQ
eukprot:scaffold1016_cov175-Ochromonas_danica.AAC.20